MKHETLVKLNALDMEMLALLLPLASLLRQRMKLAPKQTLGFIESLPSTLTKMVNNTTKRDA